MQWERGFFRITVAASLIWSGIALALFTFGVASPKILVAFEEKPENPFGDADGAGKWICSPAGPNPSGIGAGPCVTVRKIEEIEAAREVALIFSIIIFAPSLGILASFYVGRWIARGFKKA